MAKKEGPAIVRSEELEFDGHIVKVDVLVDAEGFNVVGSIDGRQWYNEIVARKPRINVMRKVAGEAVAALNDCDTPSEPVEGQEDASPSQDEGKEKPKRNPNGHCGDELAVELKRLYKKHKDPKVLFNKIAKVIGEKDAVRYDHLNRGMQRMNWGNRLRKACKINLEILEKVKKW